MMISRQAPVVNTAKTDYFFAVCKIFFVILIHIYLSEATAVVLADRDRYLTNPVFRVYKYALYTVEFN